jgi:hypothetical protein
MKPSKNFSEKRWVVVAMVVVVLGGLVFGLSDSESASPGYSATGSPDLLLLSETGSDSIGDPGNVLREIGLSIQREKLVLALGQHAQGLTPEGRERLADLILEVSAEHQIDPFLIAAVARVESNFRSTARSHKGALGLLQVMPATGRQMARLLGISEFGPDSLHDPEVNIRIGVAYLARLLKAYRGNMVLAVTAYNWGPNAVRQLLRNGGLSSRHTEYYWSVQRAYSRMRKNVRPHRALVGGV